MAVWQAVWGLEVWALLATAWGGYAGSPGWLIVPLCTAVLAVSLLPTVLALRPRARAAGCERQWRQTVALALLHATGVSGAAFLAGLAVRWLWALA